MFKSNKKIIRIVLFSILMVSLVCLVAFPALAQGPSGGPGALPDKNTATVTGSVAVSDNVITITPTTTPSVTLTVSSDQSVTVLYDSTTGAIKGLMFGNAEQNSQDSVQPTPTSTPGQTDNSRNNSPGGFGQNNNQNNGGFDNRQQNFMPWR